MAPVKNPNSHTGSSSKSTGATQSISSSSSSSMMESSSTTSSCLSSDPNMQLAAMRSNGGVDVEARAHESLASGLDVVGGGGGGGSGATTGSTSNGAGGCGVGNMPFVAPAVQTTIVPQSGGIEAVGGAMANAYVLRKNTEVVAPIRREFKDLNDYFLSVTESSHSSTASAAQFKRQNHHYHHRHQPPVASLAGPSNLDTVSCFDYDNFADNQRSCYPVRPIPRRTQQSRDDSFSSSTCSIPINNQTATVGVVNPTTPGTNTEQPSPAYHSRHSNNPFVRYRQFEQQQNDIVDIDELLLQRYKYIQYCIKLANKQQNSRIHKVTMVNENNENETVVNSTSLEDVATSETSERAQSVTSIHSSTTAEPSTPTYEDLQTRLEASTRNIQNMKEQQQQLMRLQNQAKEHLAEMERLRTQTTPLHRGTGENGAPDYESIEQVHTDMSSLVGRMKNLTSFIQDQNELSNMLGEDGPEILAEQQTLQQKLEGLKSHRDEMKNLILELHEVNRIAERRVSEQNQQQQQEQPKTEQVRSDLPSSSRSSAQREQPARLVPVEYSRIVPIEMVNAQKQKRPQKQQQQAVANGETAISREPAQATSDDEMADDPETAAMIQQKMADIQTMKNQLSRLKSMMETVKLIEERTEGLSPKDIGYSNSPSTRRSVEIPVQRESTPKVANTQARAFDKDRTPVQEDFNNDPVDPAITDKIHILNEVTRDLRSQALSLASERDRIRALKEDIIRRKAANAAAAGTSHRSGSGEENKNSNPERASPTKTTNAGAERDLLKEEYEAKKKEFENLCQRMQSDEQTSASVSARSREDLENRDDGEADEDEEDDTPKPDLGYYYSQPQGISCNSSLHESAIKARGKESTDSTATEAQGGPSCEADSAQSSSSRSYSVPPPMRTINNRESTWRKTSQDHYDHYGSTAAPSAAGSTGTVPPTLPTLWNPYHFYNAPYSPHFPPSSSTIVPGTHSDCMCQTNLTSLSNGGATSAGSALSQADPVMVQQFVQTQQMLINSVCQCNQMLWHQQREIDTLNNTVHMLQERLLSHTNGTDLAATIRSESVPPAGAVQNNLCPPLNRAQSEQPNHFAPLNPHHAHHLPGMVSQSSTSFHRRNMCNIQQQQLSNAGYNYAATADQQITNSMYSSAAATNLCAPMPPMPNFNNTTTVPNNTAGAPIFMHHHNNTQHPVQHNNNSNLANATQQSQNSASISQNSQPVNVSSGASNLTGSALNNQVPPGNRANNYWDNFRSYSRQNLLSSNSCKSNEEQNNQHQQQPSSHLSLQQQESPNLPIFTNSLNIGFRSDANINNLNPPNYDNKYLHTFRNRINTNSTMQNGGNGLLNAAPSANSSSSSAQPPTNYSNMMNIAAVNQPVSQQPHTAWNGTPSASDAFEASDLAHDMRNMNLNFGNNEPNKVPSKPSSLRRSVPSTSRRSARYAPSDTGSFMSQQQEASPRTDVSAELSSPSVFSGVPDSATDDTSDEIKRNLLVNALKSDKFTTKFYESIKEDVFRRIETLLRAKDGEQQFLAQFYRDNNIASHRDPLRKLYVNEVRSLSRPSGSLNGTENINGEAEDDDDEDDDNVPDNHNVLNNSNIEVQNANNTNILGLNAKDIKLLADKYAANTASTSAAAAVEQTFQFPDYELIHYIIARIHEDTQSMSVITDPVLSEVARLTANVIQNHALVKSRNKDFVTTQLHISPKRIFSKLKAKAFPRDRDGFLMWYQRYLETVLFVTLRRDCDDDPQPSRENQSVAASSNRNSNQNLLLADVQCFNMNVHQARKSNIPLNPVPSCSTSSSVVTDAAESKVENNSVQRQQQRLPPSQPIPSTSTAQHHHHVQIASPTTPFGGSNNIMNEDLAEADQICSPANLGSTDEPQPSQQLLPDNAEGQLISIPSDDVNTTHNQAHQNFLNFLLDETENNENPEEENNHNNVSSDTASVQPIDSLLHSFAADSDNAEEDADGQNQRPESSMHGTCLTVTTSGIGKRNSVP